MNDICVRCGKPSIYDMQAPITRRRYYIEGAGQLCEDCWYMLWPRAQESQKYKNEDMKCEEQYKVE